MIRLNQSEDTKISCFGEGYPKKDLIWQLITPNSNILINDTIYYNDVIAINELVLVLTNVTKSQQGVYQCSTTDPNVIENKKIQIIVQSNKIDI